MWFLRRETLTGRVYLPELLFGGFVIYEKKCFPLRYSRKMSVYNGFIC